MVSHIRAIKDSQLSIPLDQANLCSYQLSTEYSNTV
jgi:hypothetical protein